MIDILKKNFRVTNQFYTILFTTSALTLFFWWFNGKLIEFSFLADDGFLLYGSWRVLKGETPVVDFRSYDPLRYYLIAGWMAIFGTGIISFYQSLLFLKSIAIASSLWLSKKLFNKAFFQIVFVAGLAFWMYPKIKIFEDLVSILAVIVLYKFLKSPKQSLGLGIFVGVFALVGKNVGLYTFISFFLGIIYVIIMDNTTKNQNLIYKFMLGIPLGYLPIIIMFILDQEFAKKFLENILNIFYRGSTNLPIPIPWPWGIEFNTLEFSLGILFLVMPIYFLLGFIMVAKILSDKKQRVTVQTSTWHLFIASLFVGFPYLHYAFSRADIYHLSRGMAPFLISLAALSKLPQWRSKKLEFIIFVFIFSTTIFVQVFPSQGWVYRANPNHFVQYNIKGDTLWVQKNYFTYMSTLKNTIEENSNSGDYVYLAPNLSMMYYILDVPSPTHDIYPLFKSDEKTQFETISDLKENEVKMILIHNYAYDGLDERQFSNNNALLWNHIQENYQLVKNNDLPQSFYLFKK